MITIKSIKKGFNYNFHLLSLMFKKQNNFKVKQNLLLKIIFDYILSSIML